MNQTRVQRLWQNEGLRVPQRCPKRRRLGQSTVPASRLQAERPNQVWALDFMFDTTSDGRPFKVLSMCDEFPRESVGGLLGRSIIADDVVVEPDRLRLLRGAPECIRCDNGPESVARAIRNWCRQTGANTSYIEPGSPSQNPYVESFNSRARDELFAREMFDRILEAQVLYADWCWSYNHPRPHSALNYQPPAAFAKAFSQQQRSLRLDRLTWSPQKVIRQTHEFEGSSRRWGHAARSPAAAQNPLAKAGPTGATTTRDRCNDPAPRH